MTNVELDHPAKLLACQPEGVDAIATDSVKEISEPNLTRRELQVEPPLVREADIRSRGPPWPSAGLWRACARRSAGKCFL